MSGYILIVNAVLQNNIEKLSEAKDQRSTLAQSLKKRRIDRLIVEMQIRGLPAHVRIKNLKEQFMGKV